MSSNYRKYLKASPSSPVLVREVTQSLYSEAGDQACDLVLQVRLVETGWKLVAGPIHNDGDQITTHTIKYMTGFSSTKGRESTVSAGFSLAFKGLGFNMGAEHKEISSETVSGSKEVTKEYKVGPGKSLWVYQRYFKYEQYWRWRLDAWGQMWRVAAWDGGPFELVIPCIEDTTEELSTGQELTGTTQIQVQGVESSVNFNLPGKPIGDAPRASKNAIEAQHAQYRDLRSN